MRLDVGQIRGCSSLVAVVAVVSRYVWDRTGNKDQQFQQPYWDYSMLVV